ncbi:MAG: hypothetical protein M3R59_03370 [Verrucomicrobiota bacterium]|nr:hypothetical protein [Verrucomicrobiota bacterium]
MERRRERRKILWAVLASILLHFAIGISLASFGDKLTPPPPPDDDKPIELTIVDLAPPPPVTPKNAPFIDTPENRATKEEPKEKTFESNANSIAASELPALGVAPVPTQQGKNRPELDFANERHAIGSPDVRSTPAPKAPPTATPKPSIAPTPSATPKATPEISPTPNDQLMAMFRATPPPTIRAPDEELPSATPEVAATPRPMPAQPSNPAYRREKARNMMQGNISNRGVPSVNAIGTPLGRYNKMLQDTIGSLWYQQVDRQHDMVSEGTAVVHFTVGRDGKISGVRLISNSAGEAFGNICLQSVIDAKMPPIPEDLANTLPDEGLSGDFNFSLYVDQNIRR